MWEETGGITLFVNDVIKLETCAKKNPVFRNDELIEVWFVSGFFFLKHVIF